MSIRVRFAPSPTGHLHVGGARTALFNWLFARHHNGTFILRIEDTDQARSTQEATEAILEGMSWLGMDWDEGPAPPLAENDKIQTCPRPSRTGQVGMTNDKKKSKGEYGPYFQTERLAIYKEYADKLLKEGKAYCCYCTPEELEKLRQEAAGRKEAPRYNGHCRSLTEEQKKKFESEGRPKVIRFRLPAGGKTVVEDLIRGNVEFENDELDDFIIVKSDGFPTYNFAAVVDDSLMKISHIIRGDDHLSNTPRQILLYQALGINEIPKFAHLPMILGPDKTRLSKRHGATSVVEFKNQGFLAEAMLNVLARLGWGHGDQEIFSKEELIKFFSLEKVGQTAAVFDVEKLKWMNGQYIRQHSAEDIYDICIPYLRQAYDCIAGLEKTEVGKSKIMEVIKALHDRIVTFEDIVPLSSFFFIDEIAYDQASVDKHLKAENVAEILVKLGARLENTAPFTHDPIEKAFRDLAEELGVKAKFIIHPARVALTGTMQSPPMFLTVEILGKETSVKRLKDVVTRLKEGTL